MSQDKETPTRIRERLQHEEIKRNPTANMSDAVNRASVGNLGSLASALGWKGIGILILVIVIGFGVGSIFFK